MITEKIESLQHKLVKHCVKLKNSRKYREENREIILVGEAPIMEVASYHLPKTLFVPAGFELEQSLSVSNTISVSDEVARKVTGFDRSFPFALYDFPEHEDFSCKNRLLIIDEIQDPGNLGTIFRTAYALGFEGIYLTPSSVDPFNDKAISASKGTCLYLPFRFTGISELEKIIDTKNKHVYVADLTGTDCKNTSFQDPAMLVLSHEKKGARKWSFSSTSVKIPMQKGIDSMNVAVAGAILMHEMSR